jgi:hypothetical protein
VDLSAHGINGYVTCYEQAVEGFVFLLRNRLNGINLDQANHLLIQICVDVAFPTRIISGSAFLIFETITPEDEKEVSSSILRVGSVVVAAPEICPDQRLIVLRVLFTWG